MAAELRSELKRFMEDLRTRLGIYPLAIERRSAGAVAQVEPAALLSSVNDSIPPPAAIADQPPSQMANEAHFDKASPSDPIKLN